jgi:hypothetical protein
MPQTFLPRGLHWVTEAWPETISYDEISPHVDHGCRSGRWALPQAVVRHTKNFMHSRSG